MIFITIEFLDSANKPMPIPDEVRLQGGLRSQPDDLHIRRLGLAERRGSVRMAIRERQSFVRSPLGVRRANRLASAPPLPAHCGRHGG